MSSTKEYKLFINGEWVTSTSGETIAIVNPSTEEVVANVQNGTAEEALEALKAAEKAQKEWKKLPARSRADMLYKLADEIDANTEHLAQLLTKEQGKLLKVARFEVAVTASFIRYACEGARRIEGDIIPSDNPNEQIWIQKVPRGVVVAITAWNFPLALAGRKLGPALVAGNSIVIKPTSETPLATLELGNLANNVGIPAGVLNIITGPGRAMGNALVESPITKMVTMTGSTPVGQQIAKNAANNLTHVQLELGGKAPFIVFKDADIDAAVDAALHSRFDNCGQVCTCNERMYLHEDIYDIFMEKFITKTKALKVGNPMLEDTDMGPKVNAAELKHMEHLVAVSVKEGATIATGGKKPEGAEFEKGYWFEPTVLTNVTQDMTIVHEESFGPILPVLKFKTFDEVIGYANDCEYGLAAMVFTNDMNTIMKCNDELEYGEIYVNRGHGEQHQGFHNGYKLSGSGGEDGKYGFEQYMEKKTFYIKHKA
ncbi:aldehyde dehydrogenase [Cellulophaga lytica]|uniref:Lactaldehyde dehydrogenase n=1 Tax=Cellulophaga lytica (strain ATCC 23178 / DSM 7489 / JCM 8516 / NBRC 14961 / NCIMB 1423 / VKM B-1433 / Cy l20) TaxID=867900 RepID=F0RIC0_CELLC|nr:aldehyde dehydrogenase [Cellulophaga lytica]ADY28246.1 Lactaldehyde dehydrogenase [Cellulophaga lytica DSM 7489]AIM59315.1 aldehyde dehydrogenase [Cellulophaga lytica]APU09131.1 aldehyde dehydrogenase [Cellulophaga lytica]MDO6853730.1 aldehyde dehydrogenase [Cellulophaga lytica]WQG77573.1 aldehyde dehydrogenase [Cellulophaga lytica]